MKKLILSLIVLTMFTSEANACFMCRLFKRHHRTQHFVTCGQTNCQATFVPQVYVAPQVIPVAPTKPTPGPGVVPTPPPAVKK